MKTTNAIRILSNTAMLKSELPEVYNKLFRFKSFDKFQKKISLRQHESVSIKGMAITNPYPNVEIILLVPKERKPFLICACSMN